MWQGGQRDPWIAGKSQTKGLLQAGMERTEWKHGDRSTHLKAPAPRSVCPTRTAQHMPGALSTFSPAVTASGMGHVLCGFHPHFVDGVAALPTSKSSPRAATCLEEGRKLLSPSDTAQRDVWMLRGMCGPSKCKHRCPAKLRTCPWQTLCWPPCWGPYQKKHGGEEDPAEYLEDALSTHGSSSECSQSQQCQHQVSTLAHGFPGSLKLRQLPPPRQGSCGFGLQLHPAAALHGTSSCPCRSAAGSEGWPTQHSTPQHETARLASPTP